MRLTTAVAAGKLARLASRRLGRGGGTALPGVVAGRLDGSVLVKLAGELWRGSVLVTGTNGKTTTSRLIAAMMDAAGWRPIHNRAGANLASGVTAALIEGCDVSGRLAADAGLFEVDEAVMPRLAAAIQPRAIVLTNLFRDQLDRYGEVDHVAAVWEAAVAALPPTTTLVLNADDPALAALAAHATSPVLFYGLDTPGDGRDLDHIADSKTCPHCGRPLEYTAVRYAHLGTYRCPADGFRRPDVAIAATDVTTRGVEATAVEVHGPFGARRWTFKLSGLYNVYNLLGAVGAAVALGLPIEAIERGVFDVSAAFGRLERIPIGDNTLLLALIKNPVGFGEVLRAILSEPGEHDLAIFINDNLADGTDVSWLWDANVEAVAGRCRFAIVGGTRGRDMAVRLKYAGVSEERVIVADSIERGLAAGLALLPPGGTLNVLPTYTALLELRTLLGKRGYASHDWKM